MDPGGTRCTRSVRDSQVSSPLDDPEADQRFHACTFRVLGLSTLLRMVGINQLPQRGVLPPVVASDILLRDGTGFHRPCASSL